MFPAFLSFCSYSCFVFWLDTPSNFDFTPFTGELYHCTLIRLKAADIDQEVKERAISCMGQIICNLGDYLQVKQIFKDRTKKGPRR